MDEERVDEERTYKIGEFAAMTGMAQSKVRFYERAGLFPVRKHPNGYRYYTVYDSSRANIFRVLLQYGFTVEQAIDMLNVAQGDEEFIAVLRTQREHLLKEAELLERRLARIDKTLSILEDEPSAGFEVVDFEDQLCVRASRGLDFSDAFDNERAVAVFNELLGVSDYARIYTRAALGSGAETVVPNYTLAMPVCEADRLGDDDAVWRGVFRMSMGKCLRFMRRLTREQSMERASFDPMFAWLDDHGYRLRGDVLLFPAFLNLDGQGCDVETLYAPIS